MALASQDIVAMEVEGMKIIVVAAEVEVEPADHAEVTIAGSREVARIEVESAEVTISEDPPKRDRDVSTITLCLGM